MTNLWVNVGRKFIFNERVCNRCKHIEERACIFEYGIEGKENVNVGL